MACRFQRICKKIEVGVILSGVTVFVSSRITETRQEKLPFTYPEL